MGNNKNNLLPLYWQVEEYLRQQIEGKIIKPGEKILTEIELQKKFNVSRTTVRKAIERLVIVGRVEKKQGKGTFVKECKFERIMTHISSVTEEIESMGMIPGTKELCCVKEAPNPFIKDRLRLADGEKIIRYDRLRYADQTPICILYTWLPEKLFPGFVEKEKCTKSLYALYDREYGIVPTKVNETIEATLPNKEESDLLNIIESAPVMNIIRLSYDSKNRPIEFVKGIFRGDSWKYKVELRARV